MIEELLSEVSARADEATPEILVRLLERLETREGLVRCERHTSRLVPYVHAQLALHRAHKKLRHCDYLDSTRRRYDECKAVRDRLRAAYRNTPCTCWVPHR